MWDLRGITACETKLQCKEAIHEGQTNVGVERRNGKTATPPSVESEPCASSLHAKLREDL